MIKKITTIVSNNRETLAHRALVLGGTVLGAIVVDGILNKVAPTEPEVVIVEEVDDEEESQETEQPTE